MATGTLPGRSMSEEALRQITSERPEDSQARVTCPKCGEPVVHNQQAEHYEDRHQEDSNKEVAT